jgi:hypothetical protein
MARKVFHSFRYLYDSQRVQQVRNIGALDGQSELTANEWEDKKKAGDAAVEAWIDEKLKGRSCVIVLIGAHTNNRKWVKYEMTEGWNKRKGVLGIRIHKLKNLAEEDTTAGPNPLGEITVGDKKLSAICKTYDPPGATSTAAYNHIANNIEDWVEKAIEIRNNN